MATFVFRVIQVAQAFDLDWTIITVASVMMSLMEFVRINVSIIRRCD
jgi:hypothetical protein